MAESANKVRTLPLAITLIFTACLTLLIGNGLSITLGLGLTRESAAWINHTWEVLQQLQRIRSQMLDAETGHRGYLLTGKADFLQPYRATAAQSPAALDALASLVGDDPAQMAQLAQLRILILEKFRVMQATIDLYAPPASLKALELIYLEEGRQSLDRIRFIIGTMEDAEHNLLVVRTEKASRQYWTTVVLALAVNTIAAVVLTLFYRLIRRNYRQRLDAEKGLRQANETLEATVERRTEQLSFLSRHLIMVSENEKSRLARDLHDELGASLAAINMDISVVAKKIQTIAPALADRLQRTLDNLHSTIDVKRRIIEGLRPAMLDSLGLSAALHNHCEEFTRQTGVPCKADVVDEIGEIDPAWSIAMFRIVQESLTNITKYAQAKDVKILLKREPAGMRLQVIDDGIGIPPEAMNKAMSHGLLGMRERVTQLGGTFSVSRGAGGRGTVVEAFLRSPA